MRLWLIIISSLFAQLLLASENTGFYRFPSLHNDTVMFTAEGDLWTVPVSGGQAARLTSNHGFESHGEISPDGSKVAFMANYDGPRELYVMPISGGSPERLTFTNSSYTKVVGWTDDNRILFSSNHDSDLSSNARLFIIDPTNRQLEKIPLNQASDGVLNQHGHLYFTRLIGSSDNTRNYHGGTAKNLWLYKPNQEATPLTADYTGTSTSPMIWKNRVYFESDRSGIMNIWSMDFEGKNLKQHTFFEDQEVSSPALHKDRMVFQVGADLHLLDLNADKSHKLPITLGSDLEQKRPRWIEYPAQYLTDVSLSADNSFLLLTARGHITARPVEKGRTVHIPAPEKDLFFTQAQYIPASGKVLAVAGKGKQLSLWLLSPNGQNDSSKVLDLNNLLSSGPFVSPDGQKIVWADSQFTVWLTDLETKESTQVDQGKFAWPATDVSWSPDNRWFAYTKQSPNLNNRIYLYNLATKQSLPATSDRYNSENPVWSSDGQWLAFLSKRFYVSKVPNPYGYAQPEPYSEQNDGIFMLAINSEAQWPFKEENELTGQEHHAEPEKPAEEPSEFTVKVDTENFHQRLYQVPVIPGSFSSLAIVGNFLYWLEPGEERSNLMALRVSGDDPEPFTVASRVSDFAPSFDQEGLYYEQDERFYLLEAGADENKAKSISLENWRIRIDPAAEWRQMIYDSWLAYRDYFADKTMNGKNWDSILEDHLPLVERATDRNELDAILSSMLGQLGVLHTYTFPGDERDNYNRAFEGALGADFTKQKDGFRIDNIIKPDPEKPFWQSPLAEPGLTIQEGDLLTHINHQPVSSAITPEELLTFQADTQTLLEIKRKDTDETYQEVVEPLSPFESRRLRYRSWVNSNRLKVEDSGQEQIGYVHLPALTAKNFSEWVQQFYSVHNRKGLILDLRYNNGGNISSWILSRLMRKAYTYVSYRGVSDDWVMNYAFRGHIVLLVNEYTSSDAEELMDGFRKLQLGTIVGTRSWGGRIFMFDYELLDKGAIALPVFGHALPNSQWPAENWGVEPDVRVDNLPHASFMGEDAQLMKAVQLLQEKIEQEPIPEPALPPTPIAPLPYKKSGQ